VADRPPAKAKVARKAVERDAKTAGKTVERDAKQTVKDAQREAKAAVKAAQRKEKRATKDPGGSTTGDPASDIPHAVALLWGLQAPGTRGPKPGLSVEQIVEAAIELADAGGLAAVSMSKVAASLGFTTMSLYRYVSSKDDLLLLMSDIGLGPPPELGTEPSDWRAGLERWARALLATYRTHPWAMDIVIKGPPMTPNQLRWLDRMLQVLGPTKLTYQEQLNASLLIDGYVRSWAQLSRGLLQSVADGHDATNTEGSFAEGVRLLVDPVTYPALAPMIAAGEFDPTPGVDPVEDLEEIFAFGIARILDGLEVLIDLRA
jgi:AcrR family transcriptional regulator